MSDKRKANEARVVKRIKRQATTSLFTENFTGKGNPIKRGVNLQFGKTTADRMASSKAKMSPNEVTNVMKKARKSKFNNPTKKGVGKASATAEAKTIAKTALKTAGPVGVAVSLFDFLKGKPAH